MYAYSRLEASDLRLELYELPPSAYICVVNGGDGIRGRGRKFQSNQQNTSAAKGKFEDNEHYVLCAFGL